MNIEKQVVGNKRAGKKIYKFFKLLMFLVVLIIMVFIFINTIKISNYEAFVIISESMKPSIHVGDIIVIKKVDTNDIKKEDIITFEKNDEYITHRIKEIKVQNGEISYITKGDNNQTNDDEEVKHNEVKGKMIFKIPYVGKIIIQASNKKVYIIILAIAIILYRIALGHDNKNKERIRKKRIIDENKIQDK